MGKYKGYVYMIIHQGYKIEPKIVEVFINDWGAHEWLLNKRDELNSKIKEKEINKNELYEIMEARKDIHKDMVYVLANHFTIRNDWVCYKKEIGFDLFL